MDLRAFLARLSNVKGPNGSGQYMARCPVHDDRTASLSISEGDKGIVYKCMAGCTQEAVREALGIEARDLFYHPIGDKQKKTEKRQEKQKAPPEPFESYERAYGYLGAIEKIYDYVNAQGKLEFQVVRIKQGDDKTFRQVRPVDPAKGPLPCYRNVLDGHKMLLYRLPDVMKAIADNQPVFVCEGEKDCDNMAALGYAATTSPMGAGKWRKEHAKTLTGADVYIIPDNDEPGARHGEQVAHSLAGIAKSVRVLSLLSACPKLPAKGDATDFFRLLGKAKGKNALAKLMKDTPSIDLEPEARLNRAKEIFGAIGGYCIDHNSICQQTDDGARRLCTFVALPRTTIEVDNGVTIDQQFEIDGWRDDGMPLKTIRLTAADFAPMNWPLKHWGFDANIMPGNAPKDKLRYAIQEAGKRSSRREVRYTHTGWRRIGGKWAYLYSGGAIGAENVNVELDDRLSVYNLDCEDDGISYADAAMMSLSMRAAMSEHIGIPLTGMVYLAPLREFLRKSSLEPRFLLFLAGSTGTRKTTGAALAMSHFGRFTAGNPPANFHDTANTIRSKAFVLKDMPLLIDDYHPETSALERRKMEATAQNLARAFGDGADRGRLNAELKMTAGMPPRGIAVVTGEDLPNIGESGLARFFLVQVEKEDIPVGETLDNAQADARKGIYRKVMRGYIEWLAGQADTLPALLEEKYIGWRTRAIGEVKGMHSRAPEAIAHLMLGVDMMLDYFLSLEIYDESGAADEAEAAWKALLLSSTKQSIEAYDDRPSRMFTGAIGSLLLSGAAAVRSLKGLESTEIRNLIGYQDEQYYYLLADAAFAAVSRMYNDQGHSFPLTKNMLMKQLKADGMIMPGSDGRATRVMQLMGKSVRLLWVKKEAVDGPRPPAVTQVAMDGVVRGKRE